MTWTKIYSVTLGYGIVVVWVLLLLPLISQFYFHERYVIVKSCFLRGIAAITAVAIYSLKVQAVGLIGDNGLYPIQSSIQTISKYLAMTNTRDFLSSETMMKFMLRLVYEKFQAKEDSYNQRLKDNLVMDWYAAIVGILWPHPIVYIYLYISYYGYKRITGPFLNFQWDALLLESLFLAFVLSLSCVWWMDTIVIWLIRLLLFRLMFGSGMVKAYGKDISWFEDYSAMSYHFLTQPLPNYWALCVYTRLTRKIYRWLTFGTLIAEVNLPLLSVILPVPWINVLVGMGYAGLMLSIGLTGYYGKLSIHLNNIIVS
jgi:lipase maturation factor 1